MRRRSSASGVLMMVYVVFGGMLATTWVQIIKAVLLMSGSVLLSILVMAHFDFSFAKFFEAVSAVTSTDANGATVTQNFLTPGSCASRIRSIRFRSAWRWFSGRRGCRTFWCASTRCRMRRRPAPAWSGR